MSKKCIICQEEAVLKIKATADFYCQECAEENFADLSFLLTVEEEAQSLKKALENIVVKNKNPDSHDDIMI